MTRKLPVSRIIAQPIAGSTDDLQASQLVTQVQEVALRADQPGDRVDPGGTAETGSKEWADRLFSGGRTMSERVKIWELPGR